MLDHVVAEHYVERPPAIDDTVRGDVLDGQIGRDVVVGELKPCQVDELGVDVDPHYPAGTGLLRRNQEPAVGASDIQNLATGKRLDSTHRGHRLAAAFDRRESEVDPHLDGGIVDPLGIHAISAESGRFERFPGRRLASQTPDDLSNKHPRGHGATVGRLTYPVGSRATVLLFSQ